MRPKVFAYWTVVMEIRLRDMIYWPSREELWATMPMCFQYSFGKKVTVVIDCIEVTGIYSTAKACYYGNSKHPAVTVISLLLGWNVHKDFKLST